MSSVFDKAELIEGKVDKMFASVEGEVDELLYTEPKSESESEYVTVTFELVSMAPDRIQYKPYGALLTGKKRIYIQTKVLREEVIAETDEYVILRPAGLASAMDEICSAYEATDKLYKRRLMKG